MPDTAISNPDFGNYTIRGIEEIVIPPAVSWMPVTPAWKVAGLILLALLVMATYQAFGKWRSNQYRRDALKTITELRNAQHASGTELVRTLSALPSVLKSTALKAYPRTDVASLSGQAWLEFLNSNVKRQVFDDSNLTVLHALAYQGRIEHAVAPAEADELLDRCEMWVRTHQAAQEPRGSD